MEILKFKNFKAIKSLKRFEQELTLKVLSRNGILERGVVGIWESGCTYSRSGVGYPGTGTLLQLAV